MGRKEGAVLSGKLAIPTYEQFIGAKHSNTIVGTSVTQVPAANLSNRKAILIQNKHAGNVVYLGGGIPYVFIGKHQDAANDEHDKRIYQWFHSASGTHEWFLADSAKTAPSGLSQVTYLYYATIGGSETLATAGTVGSLAAEHRWGWGTTAEVSGNTIFIRTNGASPANSPKFRYETILGYYFSLTADDTSLTGGIELAAGNAISATLDGSVRIFAIASGATTAVGTWEFI